MNLDFSPFSLPIIKEYILPGLSFSVQTTIIVTILGLFFGTLLAMMRLSSFKTISAIATAYIVIMRSIPLLMVILWFFLLIPLLTGAPLGEKISTYITFTAFEAAYFAEIMRSGIKSVAKGQYFAAKALGMTYMQKMRIVILPQAFRNMLPVLLTQVIILFQDTSLVYAIGAYDLLKGFEQMGKNYGRLEEAYILAAITYFIICFILSQAVKYFQKKVAINR